MFNIYLFQPQYTAVINGQVNHWIPYSVGTIWCYAIQYPEIVENFNLSGLFFKREKIENVIAKIENPSVCGFSCYMWNRIYCLELAKKIKEKWPNCIIAFGGPEVNSTFLQYEYIDSIVQAEGEETFVEILRNIKDNKPIEKFMPKKRVKDLSTIPSPYILGIFDKIIEENPDAVWAMTLETNRGCPYSCTFCDWGSLTYSKVSKFEIEKVFDEIEWIRNRPISYVYLADANFGIFKERDLEIAKKLREVTDSNPIVEVMSVITAKNSTENIFMIGQALGPKYLGVSIALQSFNEDTLDAIKRKNLPTNNLEDLLKMSTKYNVPTYTELILGMPNETLESWKDGFTKVIELGQHNVVEMYWTQLLVNSELASPTNRLLHGIKSIQCYDYIDMHAESNDGISESVEIICETKTMSKNDMIEGYMYGWMITKFHFSGYSQVISRYLRVKNDLSYKNFYDKFYEYIQTDSLIKLEFFKMKKLVTQFLSEGKIDDGPGHILHKRSNEWLYDNKNELINRVVKFAEQYGAIPKWVVELQSVFVFDLSYNYPLEISGDCDIVEKKNESVVYKVIPKIKDVKSLSLVSMRRKGSLKNQLITERL